MKEENTNCLQGWKCPDCGQSERFIVTALSDFELFDDGSDHFAGMDFDELSPVRCPNCDWNGVVGEAQGNGGRVLVNKLILRNLAHDIVDTLLTNSRKWPDGWDGLEMRGLLLRAVEFECKTWFDKNHQLNPRSKRGREFAQDWVNENLY